MRLRLLRAGLTMVVTGVLVAGCTPSSQFVPTIAPTAEAIFSTDEEALAAVVAHYQEYLAVSDAVYADGGANPERLKPYVSEEIYLEEEIGANSFHEEGLRTEGKTRSYNSQLQSAYFSEGSATVSFYICVDVSEVGLFDSRGERLPDASIPFPYEVRYQVHESDGNLEFEIIGDEVWLGNYSC